MTGDSTAYSLLVRPHLQAELEHLNLPDLKVQTNQILVGASGQKHQIDLTFKFTLTAGMDFLVLVECKQYQRKKVTVEAVETLHRQVIDIGTHKGVFVTTTSFQLAAGDYARAHGISLSSLRSEIQLFISSSWDSRTTCLIYPD